MNLLHYGFQLRGSNELGHERACVIKATLEARHSKNAIR
jgi:hypothetical protein